MAISTFITVGENIHCTRIYKVGGVYVKPDSGGFAIEYKSAGKTCKLPVPESFTQTADWEAEKVKHCAVAIWQGRQGDAAGQAAGIDYLRQLAIAQERAGADYLDLNVDEFITDIGERAEIMEWLVDIVQGAAGIPVCIDSSNQQILEAGLKAADPARGKPMINSVSLERLDAVPLAGRYGAVVVASAAGEDGLPCRTDDRLANLERLMPQLKAQGLALADVHVDPLVFPVSVDPENGLRFLDACKAIRATYGPEIHLVAGLSNISFGMPNRKLINQVFARMAVEAGADGGIVDPFQINRSVLNGLEMDSEPCKLATALLTGADEFGMEFITASRDGRL